MRIGTWNLDNRLLTEEHRDILVGEWCDVWLLTELNSKAVDPDGRIAGFHCHLSLGVMGRKQHWAAVLSREALTSLPDPHPASAAAIVNGVTFCSTILPWATCGNGPPWVGKGLAEQAANAVFSLVAALPRKDLVWGGDWNQNLEGGWEHVGTNCGAGILNAATRYLNLKALTAGLFHQNSISHTIDHIAVPTGWKVKSAARVQAAGLADHDAYIVEVYDPRRWISENAYLRWMNESNPGDRTLPHWLEAENEFHAL